MSETSKSKQHTPGPWRLKEYNDAVVVIQDEDEEFITHFCISRHADGGKDEEAEANAQLAVSAPDLLAALESAERALCNASSDIWQTARANQMNLNGTDPAIPGDNYESAIGTTQVHQSGIDESLRVRRKCEEAIRDSRAAIAKAKGE